MCACAWVGSIRRGGQCSPGLQETLIPKGNPTLGLSLTEEAGSLPFSSGPRPPGELLSRPQFPDCTKTGRTRNSVSAHSAWTQPRSLSGCVRASSTPTAAGPPADSPGNLPSSSASAAHRQPQGAAQGSQRPLASARAQRSGASGCGAHGAASGPRQARGSAALANAAPIVCAAPLLATVPAVEASLLGSAGAPGTRDGWAGRERPRPGPAQPARRCEGRATAHELGDARARGRARPVFSRGARHANGPGRREVGLARARCRQARTRDPASPRARGVRRVL